MHDFVRFFSKDEKGQPVNDLKKLQEKGLTLMHEGKFTDAVGVFMEGGLIASSQNNEDWEMRMALNTGVAWAMLEEPVHAIIALEEARELAEKRNDVDAHILTLIALAKAHIYLKEDQNALKVLDKCAEIMKETGKTTYFAEVGQLVQYVHSHSGKR